MIFLQETMVSVERARIYFQSIRKKWVICYTDAIGQYGGLLSAWDPKVFQLSSFSNHLEILMEGFIQGVPDKINLVNVYGSYSNRQHFWDATKHEGLLDHDHLLLAGDFNITLSSAETWGKDARLDNLCAYLYDFFEDLGLNDIAPIPLSPTWCNDRLDDGKISKRLDRFMLSDRLLSNLHKFRTWSILSTISDHLPIILEGDL